MHDRDAVAPIDLGLIHGRIRPLQGFGKGHLILLDQKRADAGGELAGVIREQQSCATGSTDAICERRAWAATHGNGTR